MKVNFKVLVQLSLDNKNASTVMMCLLDKWDGDSLFATGKTISDATGLNRGSASRGLEYLIQYSYITNDYEGENLYYLNARIAHDAQWEYKFLNCDLPQTKRIAGPSHLRKVMREVEAMNEMSEEDISEANFGR